MRMEVHVHGFIALRPGASVAQVESALRPWLSYLDVDTLDEAKSIHPDEPGLAFDSKVRTLEICWSGDVGRNFRQCVEEALHALCPLTEQAAEIEVSYYYDDGQDEFGLVFVGPTAEAIHEAQRRRMVEDVSDLLARHFDKDAIAEVTSLVNHLFARQWAEKGASRQADSLSYEPIQTSPGRKHLH